MPEAPGYQPLSQIEQSTKDLFKKQKRAPAVAYLLDSMIKTGQTLELIRLINAKPRFKVRTVNGHEITETINRKAEWEARRLQRLDNEQGAQTNDTKSI
jgi:hypothetical protein